MLAAIDARNKLKQAGTLANICGNMIIIIIMRACCCCISAGEKPLPRLEIAAQSLEMILAAYPAIMPPFLLPLNDTDYKLDKL